MSRRNRAMSPVRRPWWGLGLAAIRKRYLIWFEDEYQNNYMLGYFDSLGEASEVALAEVEAYCSCGGGTRYIHGPVELRESPNTLGPSIDCEIPLYSSEADMADGNFDSAVFIRGFVLK